LLIATVGGGAVGYQVYAIKELNRSINNPEIHVPPIPQKKKDDKGD